MSNENASILLSVVVPVYNTTLYLDDCLRSLLHQGLRADELEIVIVDDGSTDGSDLLIKKWQKKSSSVRAIAQQNGGLSVARNTGIRHASGEYVTFVDSDDLIPRNTFRKMLDILERTGSDLITGPPKRFSRSIHETWDFNRTIDLYGQQRERLTLGEYPEYVRDFLGCNKVYRREFLLEAGLEFPPGRIYEDVATSSQLYHKARTFDVFAEPSYFWRVTPNGITQSINSRKAYDRLWALRQVHDYFEAQDTSPNLKSELGFAIVDYNLRWIFLEYRHYDVEAQKTVLIEARGLLTEIDDEVIARVQQPISEWALMAKRGEQEGLHDILTSSHIVPDLPVGESGVGSPQAIWSQSTRQIARSVRDRIRLGFSRARNSFIYLVYRPIVLRFPVNSRIAVFSSYWGRNFSRSDGPPAICMELMRLSPDFTCVVFADKSSRAEILEALQATEGYSRRVKIVVNQSLRYYWYFWRAKYLFNDVNYLVGFRSTRYIERRPEQIDVQTSHGIPLKKIGLDSQERLSDGARAKFLAKTSRYSHLVSSSPEVARIFSGAYGIDPIILKTGLPQNDFLFEDQSAVEIKKLKSRLGIPLDKKIVLYAPTFRHGEGYGFRYLIDFLELKSKLGEGFHVVVKTHNYNHTLLSSIDFVELTQYSSSGQENAFVTLLGEVVDDRNLLPTETPEVFKSDVGINELMMLADLLVTDYSSLMFGYVHLGKPAVFFTPDIEHYNKTRGSYFDIDEVAPGAVTKDTTELAEAVLAAENTETWQLLYGSRIKQFKHRFLTWEHGGAARKILCELGMVSV